MARCQAATTFVPWRLAVATAGLASVALLTAGCGPNSGPSSPATASSGSPPASVSPSAADPVVCADASALRATLAKIPHALTENSEGTLTADLDTAKTELDHLADASDHQYRAQSGGLKSALTSLQNAISADAHGTGSILTVFTAAGHVAAQAHFLVAAAGDCPLPSPSAAS